MHTEKKELADIHDKQIDVAPGGKKQRDNRVAGGGYTRPL